MSRVCLLLEVSFFSQKESQQLHGILEAEGNQTACYEIYVVTLLASFTLLISYFFELCDFDHAHGRICTHWGAYVFNHVC